MNKEILITKETIMNYISKRLCDQKINDESIPYSKDWVKGWHEGIKHSIRMLDIINNELNEKNNKTIIENNVEKSISPFKYNNTSISEYKMQFLKNYLSYLNKKDKNSMKINKFKKEVKQRAINAKEDIGVIPCDIMDCMDCIYNSNNRDEWGHSCKLLKARNLLKEIIKISEKSPQYIIVSKPLFHNDLVQQIYGPASKEECENVAKNLNNVEIVEHSVIFGEG